MAYATQADVRPQEGRQRQFMQDIQAQKVDFCLIGGSRFGGKSELLTMIDVLFAHDKHFNSIKFRRSYEEIMGGGSIWDKADSQYSLFGAEPNKTAKTWTWPSGAVSAYRHMYHEKDADAHRGKSYSYVAFDEINHFSFDQVSMLQTCLRSDANMNSFMVGTMNPDPDSWAMQFVDYYLDQNTGYPIPERCGEIRWYIIKEGDVIFGPDEQFFIDNHPDSVYVTTPNGEVIYTPAKRFSFYFFNIFDNEIGLKLNPQYLSELNNLPNHQRETQLYGNWFAREKGDNIFQREWLKEIDAVPAGSICVRTWDKAYTENVKSKPDFTASIKMWKTPNRDYVITGDWDETIHDDFLPGQDIIYGQFRKLAGDRDLWMLQQAEYDGKDCTQVHPEESGAGKGECEQISKMFIEAGFKTDTVKVGNTSGAKMDKFTQFTSVAQKGYVYIVKSSFGNVATLNAYLGQLEKFDGKRSTATKKDDWVDVTSDGYIHLRSRMVHTTFKRPNTKARQNKLTTLRNAIRR